MRVKMFSASWCTACKAVLPKLKEIFPDVEVLDISDEESVKYNICSIPHFVVMEDEELVYSGRDLVTVQKLIARGEEKR